MMSTIGAEGNSVLYLWSMEIDGVYIGDFSIRHSGARRSIGLCPCNIIKYVDYCKGSSIARTDSPNMYLSKSQTPLEGYR